MVSSYARFRFIFDFLVSSSSHVLLPHHTASFPYARQCLRPFPPNHVYNLFPPRSVPPYLPPPIFHFFTSTSILAYRIRMLDPQLTMFFDAYTQLGTPSTLTRLIKTATGTISFLPGSFYLCLHAYAHLPAYPAPRSLFSIVSRSTDCL